MLKHLLIAFLLHASSVPQEPSVTLKGSWNASSQSRTFRGTWSAELQPKAPDTAQGTWTLLDDQNRVILQGTWAAQKNARGWSGSWSARIAARTAKGVSSGNPISGTWRAQTEPGGGTLLDMLQRTLERSAAGTWQSGPYSGKWALSGSRQ